MLIFRKLIVEILEKARNVVLNVSLGIAALCRCRVANSLCMLGLWHCPVLISCTSDIDCLYVWHEPSYYVIACLTVTD